MCDSKIRRRLTFQNTLWRLLPITSVQISVFSGRYVFAPTPLKQLVPHADGLQLTILMILPCERWRYLKQLRDCLGSNSLCKDWCVILGRERDDFVVTIVAERHTGASTETAATEGCRLQSNGRTNQGTDISALLSS